MNQSTSQSPQIADTPVVILCGGNGIFIDESGKRKLKGLVEVAGEPILMHLIRSYRKTGFQRFILCAGYQTDDLKKVLKTKYQATPVSGERYEIQVAGQKCQIEVVDTGAETRTGDRLKKIEPLVSDSSVFCVTYSDTLSNLNLKKLFDFHTRNGKVATLVSTQMPTRFRVLGLRYGEDQVRGFATKAVIQNDLINGGYYIFNREIWDSAYLGNKSISPLVLETHVLEELVKNQQLLAYRIKENWQHLDTERDLQQLSEIAKAI